MTPWDVVKVALFFLALAALQSPEVRGEVDIGLPIRVGDRTWDPETGEETTPSKLKEGD